MNEGVKDRVDSGRVVSVKERVVNRRVLSDETRCLSAGVREGEHLGVIDSRASAQPNREGEDLLP